MTRELEKADKENVRTETGWHCEGKSEQHSGLYSHSTYINLISNLGSGPLETHNPLMKNIPLSQCDYNAVALIFFMGISSAVQTQNEHTHTSGHWGHTSSCCVLISSVTLSVGLCSAARQKPALHKSPPPSHQEGHSVPNPSLHWLSEKKKAFLSSLFSLTKSVRAHFCSEDKPQERDTKPEVFVARCFCCSWLSSST